MNNNSPYFFTHFLFPIVVAIVTYLLVDRLGVWRKWREYSKLGVAIIDSLQEEIKNGIKIMKAALEMADEANKGKGTGCPSSPLPRKSWQGMTTIPDDVLLRIIETSSGHEYKKGFHPKDCRIHCKNYFEFICQNYEDVISSLEWNLLIRKLLVESKEPYIEAATEVHRMLENAKKLLKKNSKAWMPK